MNLVFSPGLGSSPTQQTYSVVNFRYVQAYAGSPQLNIPGNPSTFNDIGVCILDRDLDPAFGAILPLTNAPTDFTSIMALGYPADRDGASAMWICEGEFNSDLSIASKKLVMASDFIGGSSGGPWSSRLRMVGVPLDCNQGKPAGQPGDIRTHRTLAASPMISSSGPALNELLPDTKNILLRTR